MTGSPPQGGLGQAAEATVIALAMTGDSRAFSELVRRRQSSMRNLLRRLCRDATLADDLAQQVFIKAWRSLPKLRSVAAYGAWLRRLAINTWLEHVRAFAPATVELDSDELPGALTESRTSDERMDLDQALGELAPAERLCVVLAYNEGMSHSEISAATELPLGTVKSHVKRGSARLRGRLKAYEPLQEHSHAR